MDIVEWLGMCPFALNIVNFELHVLWDAGKSVSVLSLRGGFGECTNTFGCMGLKSFPRTCRILSCWISQDIIVAAHSVPVQMDTHRLELVSK